ncbi:MAG: glutamine--fructose-6-phosphate transaminase (isomerizing) [Holosporaceae bacterium]|jgi:glucosamine--fructose-6-phosphate aminotransferase (isomerizing)|nr:glutamine--fructose-6-phosphate transaminase (isomerizing) [Holosporaceae bacterium]
MCGIIGTVARSGDDIVDQIIEGLEKLEYRGYDSAGIAVISDGKIIRERAVGKLQNLKAKLKGSSISGSLGIGHTRWATHGRPTENNAHPIISRNVAVVHNGIIENYKELKFDLKNDGYIFETETDTEVVAHFLQREIDHGASPRNAFENLLKSIEGAYAFAILFSAAPDALFAARHRSPLAVGRGKNFCVGSDASSISSMCDEIFYLEDGDHVEVTRDRVLFFDKDSNVVERKPQAISPDFTNSGKGEYSYYMLKEIMEQPNAIRKTMLQNQMDTRILDDISRILILACGTSYHAGMVSRYWFEKFFKIPTQVEIASEYRYRSPIIEDNTLMIVITQSGETIDTLEAIEYVRKNSASRIVAIANVKNSAISRAADFVFYTEAGVEVGVASTKAFTAQLTVLAMIAFYRHEFLLQKLHNIPALCEETLLLYKDIGEVSQNIAKAHSAIFLGRGSLYPIALEGALKLKEISYLHAEGFASGEMKHGPIALIDDNVPAICLCPHNELFEKNASNIQEILARGNNILVFTDASGSELLPSEVTKIILPAVNSEFAPVLYSLPLQLLAYHVAVLRGTDVDKPRNLAKSVTVE